MPPGISTSLKFRNFPETSASACAFLLLPGRTVSSSRERRKKEKRFLSLSYFPRMKKPLTGMDNFSGLPSAKTPKQTILSSCVALTYVSRVAGIFG